MLIANIKKPDPPAWEANADRARCDVQVVDTGTDHQSGMACVVPIPAFSEKPDPQGWGFGIINNSSGVAPGFPDCPLSLKQWNCSRPSAEYALRLSRKMSSKGRDLLETELLLHGALPC